MAEPTSPTGEPTADGVRSATESDGAAPATAVSAATAGSAEGEAVPADRAVREQTVREQIVREQSVPEQSVPDREAQAEFVDPDAQTTAQPTLVKRTAVQGSAVEDSGVQRTTVQDTAVQDSAVQDTDTDTDAVPPAPTERQPALTPAADAPPPPPKKQGNRLVATAWVLLAAGLFQAVFFGVNAVVALVFGGSQAVVPQIQSVAATVLAWLPVLLFFLLFELTVLLINRAGRVAYVLASLIVGLGVYVGTVILFSLISVNGLGDANTLAQTFLNWEFILVGLVAREVMLWTGLAIGSRGIRVRRRNREARRTYREEVAGARG